MLLIGILGVIEAAFLFAASRIADPIANLAAFLWPVAAAFVICMHAARVLGQSAEREPREARRDLIVVIAFGALFRALLIAAPPSLSTDVHRYVWDARAQMAGVNPFVYAPNAPEVVGLFDAGASQINHPEISTIYPPVSQAAFRVAQTLVPGPLGMKLLFALIDLSIPLLAIAALRPPPRARLACALLLAWHPLSVVETAGSGHNDPLGIALLLGAIACVRSERALLAGALLGAAAAAKTLPLLLAPLFLLAAGRRHALRFAAGLVAALVFTYFPFAGAGRALFRGLAAYSLDLEFNASLFALSSSLGRALAPPARDATHSAWAFALRLLPILPVAAAPLLWRAARGDLPRAIFWTLGALITVASQVHPWYLLWLLPFVAARPSRGWLLFSFLIFLSYETHALYRASGVWREPVGIRVLQYAPLYALLVIEAIAQRRRGRVTIA